MEERIFLFESILLSVPKMFQTKHYLHLLWCAIRSFGNSGGIWAPSLGRSWRFSCPFPFAFENKCPSSMTTQARFYLKLVLFVRALFDKPTFRNMLFPSFFHSQFLSSPWTFRFSSHDRGDYLDACSINQQLTFTRSGETKKIKSVNENDIKPLQLTVDVKC